VIRSLVLKNNLGMKEATTICNYSYKNDITNGKMYLYVFQFDYQKASGNIWHDLLIPIL